MLLCSYGESDSEESSMQEDEHTTAGEGMGTSINTLSYGSAQTGDVGKTETDLVLKGGTKSNDTMVVEGNKQISTTGSKNDQCDTQSQRNLVNVNVTQMSNSDISDSGVTIGGNIASSQTVNQQELSKNIEGSAQNSRATFENICKDIILDVKGGYRHIVTVDSETEDSASDSEESVSSSSLSSTATSSSSSSSESESSSDESSSSPELPQDKDVR